MEGVVTVTWDDDGDFVGDDGDHVTGNGDDCSSVVVVLILVLSVFRRKEEQ